LEPGTWNWSEATMPLYEFECKKCDHTFDKVLTIKEMEKALPTCPQCGSDDVRKLISSGGIKIGIGDYSGKVR
jgi:putative FmdB family regulatory protein